MQQIIIFPDSEGTKRVSGRNLCAMISGYKDPHDNFTNWFRNRITKLVLLEGTGEDFVYKKVQSPLSSHKITDAWLTIEGAIKVAKYDNANWAVDILTQAVNGTYTSELISAVDQVPHLPFFDKASFIHTLERATGPGSSAIVQLPDDGLSPAERLLRMAQELVHAERSGKEPISDARVQALEVKVDTIVSSLRVLSDFINSVLTSVDLTKGVPRLATLDEVITEPEIDDPVEPESHHIADTSTIRGQLVQLVRDYTNTHGKDYKEVWRWLYDELNRQYSFNVTSFHKGNEPYLDVVERKNWMGVFFDLAKKLTHK